MEIHEMPLKPDKAHCFACDKHFGLQGVHIHSVLTSDTLTVTQGLYLDSTQTAVPETTQKISLMNHTCITNLPTAACKSV